MRGSYLMLLVPAETPLWISPFRRTCTVPGSSEPLDEAAHPARINETATIRTTVSNSPAASVSSLRAAA